MIVIVKNLTLVTLEMARMKSGNLLREIYTMIIDHSDVEEGGIVEFEDEPNSDEDIEEPVAASHL